MMRAFVLVGVVLDVVALAPGSLLEPHSTEEPDSRFYTRNSRTFSAPAFTEVSGPKNTNKFWGNWITTTGWQYKYDLALYTMPFSIRWKERGASKAAELAISHSGIQYFTDTGNGFSPPTDNYVLQFAIFDEEITMGVEEELSETHTIVKEDLFGIHAQVRSASGSGCTLTYPITTGMAYISAKLEGGCTPRFSGVTTEFENVRGGVWKYKNDKTSEFRIYALDTEGELVGDEYNLQRMPDGTLVMNTTLDGWMRVAQVLSPDDATALDDHVGGVVLGAELDVFEGRAEYKWTTLKNKKLLHFAFPHHVKQLAPFSPAQRQPSMNQSAGPTKGKMTPLSGNHWIMQTNLDSVSSLDVLPPGDPREEDKGEIEKELHFYINKYSRDWASDAIFTEFYWTGKQLQKISTLCVMADKLMGNEHDLTQQCIKTLQETFECMWNPSYSHKCAGAPSFYYDQSWGGIVSKFGYNEEGGLGLDDFGNAGYNDHHYHFSYFVVAAAHLLKLGGNQPEGLTNYIEMMIRDSTNPSSEDTHFPRFRSFDWFDMHSWSRGLAAEPDGKDQESTSEELNLMYGIILWARERNNAKMEKLAKTMLSFDLFSISEYFLMKSDNENNHPRIAKNHVTGIFFQNKIDYNTWFGRFYEYIHGVQMLPLTPALLLSRTPEFCREEWTDVLSKLDNKLDNRWTSLLLTGSLALFKPREAMEKLLLMKREHMDDGLTKAWAVYWVSALID